MGNETLRSVLKEFVEDVEAVDGVEDDWPDLVVTYDKAVKVLEQNPETWVKSNVDSEVLSYVSVVFWNLFYRNPKCFQSDDRHVPRISALAAALFQSKYPVGPDTWETADFSGHIWAFLLQIGAIWDANLAEVTTTEELQAEIDKASGDLNKSPYLVVGIYEDTGQRFGRTVRARTAMEAEEIVLEEVEGPLSIAGTILNHDIVL